MGTTPSYDAPKEAPVEPISAEEKLQASEEKYRTILDLIDEAYFEVDLTGNYTFFNSALPKLLGYSPDDGCKR